MKKIQYITESSWFWIIPILTIWFGLLIGNRPFATPDEGRYAEIPREMVSTGDYVTPRLNGVKYFEKPALFYWIQAANIKLFGLHEWAMRISCLLFGLIGCVATYWFGRKIYTPKIGMAACFILATSPLYYALSRLIILDMAVTTLITLSLFSFLLTVQTPASARRRLWAWAFYGFSALAVLTKGLMALAISGPVILIWATLTRRWKDLWPAYMPSGILLFLAIAAPWHILASLKNPEFAYKYFVIEHFYRYTTSMHLRTQPFYFFVPVILLGLFPWAIFLLNAIKDSVKMQPSQEKRDTTIFLLIWAGWTFAFFSISNSKLVPYVLPCFTPLALILGIYWTKLIQPESHRLARFNLKVFSFVLEIMSLIGLITLWLLPQLIDHRPYLWIDFTTFAIVLMITGLITQFCLYKNQIKVALNMVRFVAILFIAVVIHLTPELQRPSIKPLAQIIQTLKKPGDVIGCYKNYYQDLPVYTNQTVMVIDTKGELEFGCEVEDCSKWMVNEDQFLKLWNSDIRFLIVSQIKEISQLTKRQPNFHYKSLGVSQNNMLISNK